MVQLERIKTRTPLTINELTATKYRNITTNEKHCACFQHIWIPAFCEVQKPKLKTLPDVHSRQKKT